MTFEFPIVIDGALLAKGVALGDCPSHVGVFETLPVEAGQALFWDAHRARLRAGAGELGIAWPGDGILGASLERMFVAQAADPRAPRDWILRVSLTLEKGARRPRLLLQGRDFVAPDPAGVSLWVAPQQHPLGPWRGLKRTPRAPLDRARAQAQAAGCYDALLANPAGEWVEGCITNLFLIQADVLSTPPLRSGCLGGILRGLLLDNLLREPLLGPGGVELRVQECALSHGSVAAADEVFLTNSVGRVIAVSSLRGAPAGERQLPGSQGACLGLLRGRVSRLEAELRPA